MDVNIEQHSHVGYVEIIQDPLRDCRMERIPAALMVVQLHGIKEINSAHSYQTSHQLLIEVAAWLEKNLRDNDFVTFLSDNRFAILLKDIRNEGHAVLAANKITNIAANTFSIDGHYLSVKASIWIALFSRHDLEADTLLQNAEVALDHAIKNGKEYMLHSSEMDKRAAAETDMLVELEDALDKEEFEVHYQPKIRAADLKPCGAEALLRWNSASYGLMSPGIFIPLIEQSPYMFRVTDFVINRALKEQLEWPTGFGKLSVSVNLSPMVFQQPEIKDCIEQALAIWGNDPSCLIFEITETGIMENPEVSYKLLNELRAKGISISIDDFGTGYSSLAYFKILPANEIKIDKSFVSTMLDDEADYKLVQAIINLSHSFGHTVVAEGVETQDALDALKGLGCDIIQGYLISEPIPHHELISWLRN